MFPLNFTNFVVPVGSCIKVILDRIDFESETGRISMAEIRVVDNGPGISDEEKNSIFEKFYCGTTKIADSRRSLGLGLYLCKAIVEAHGGNIYVEDNKPKGTVFRFTLPLKEMKIHE